MTPATPRRTQQAGTAPSQTAHHCKRALPTTSPRGMWLPRQHQGRKGPSRPTRPTTQHVANPAVWHGSSTVLPGVAPCLSKKACSARGTRHPRPPRARTCCWHRHRHPDSWWGGSGQTHRLLSLPPEFASAATSGETAVAPNCSPRICKASWHNTPRHCAINHQQRPCSRPTKRATASTAIGNSPIQYGMRTWFGHCTPRPKRKYST